MSRNALVSSLLGLSAIIAAAVLVWMPPAAVPLPSPGHTKSVIASLFPGLPPSFVLLRFGLLGFAALAGFAAANAWWVKPETLRFPQESVAPRPDAASSIGLCVLTTLLAFSLFGRSEPRWLQQLWPFLVFAVGLLAAGPTSQKKTRGNFPTRLALGTIFMAGSWSAWRLWLSLGSPRRADLGDLLEGQTCIGAASEASIDLLREGCNAGLNFLPWIPFGVGILGNNGTPPTLDTLSIVNTLLMLTTSLLVGAGAYRCGAASAAPFATAVFLGSPLVMMHSFATPIFIFSFYTAALGWLCFELRAAPSGRKFVALAALAGLAANTPNLAAVVLWCFAFLLISGCLRNLRVYQLAAALLAFACMFVPSLEAWQEILRMSGELAAGQRPWAVWEAAVAGQIDPRYVEQLAALPVDTNSVTRAVSAIVSPWATPRTPMRFWGDVFIEPLGAGLALMTIAAALRSAWRVGPSKPPIVSLTLLLCATVVGGLTSTYDRPSLTRIEALVVPLSLLASLGLAAILRLSSQHLAGWAMTWSVVFACSASLASGTLLFDLRAVSTLPQTALRIALEATSQSSLSLVVGHRIAIEPSIAEAVLRDLRPNARVLPAHALPEESTKAMLAWSPGEEDAYGIAERLCALPVPPSLFAIEDPTGIHRVFLSVPRSQSWEPAPLSAHAQDCAGTLSTEATRAKRARHSARRLVAEGELHEALEILETEARLSFAQPELFADTAAVLLLAGRKDEAEAWIDQACQLYRGLRPAFCNATFPTRELKKRFTSSLAETAVDP